MSTKPYKHNTDDAEIVNGDTRVMDAVERVKDTEWRPGAELDKLTLDLGDAANCMLCIERAAHFEKIPTTGWRAFRITDTGVILPYTQSVSEGASESEVD